MGMPPARAADSTCVGGKPVMQVLYERRQGEIKEGTFDNCAPLYTA
jgi:hypothetical protein